MYLKRINTGELDYSKLIGEHITKDVNVIEIENSWKTFSK